MADGKQIIVIRKKVVRPAHHGGAWKVAYADFVTAMMALFILLWLMSSSSKRTQEVIASYFRDPAGTAAKMGSDHVGSDDNFSMNRQQMAKLKQSLMQAIQHENNLVRLKNQIEMTITPEGLRIELMEDPKGTFFESGSVQPTPVLVELLKVLAVQIGKMPNRISIEGHTDAAPYSGSQVYSNWELSSDRANVARRLMQSSGLHSDQVSQVRGFAAERPRDPAHPLAASNRRISLIVQWPNAHDQGFPMQRAAGAAAAAKPGPATSRGSGPIGSAPRVRAAVSPGTEVPGPAGKNLTADVAHGGSPAVEQSAR